MAGKQGSCEILAKAPEAPWRQDACCLIAPGKDMLRHVMLVLQFELSDMLAPLVSTKRNLD